MPANPDPRGGVVHWDMSTHLAHRAIHAGQIMSGWPTVAHPPAPSHVALPGAKMAVEHERLLAYQQAGVPADEIVGRVNERWAVENRAHVERSRAWAAGPYREAIAADREAQMRRAAEDLRRRALFEEIMAEREHETAPVSDSPPFSGASPAGGA